jgi:hypothetical protein
MRTFAGAFILVLNALCSVPSAALSAPSLCSVPRDSMWQLRPTNPAYADAVELKGILEDHHIEVTCVAGTTIAGHFLGDAKSASIATDAGRFDVAFFPAPDGAEKVSYEGSGSGRHYHYIFRTAQPGFQRQQIIDIDGPLRIVARRKWFIFAWNAATEAAIRRALGPAPNSHPPTDQMSTKAVGTFEVKIAPLAAYNTAPGTTAGRMSIDKQFHGDLEAVSVGEMLTGGDYKKGGAGYVAIESVTGSLNGKKGGFMLQHTGTVNNGEQSLTVTVIPGTGTGELTGISGTMRIIIDKGKHSYEFDYALPSG